jgi:hypothetical protein
MSNIYVTGVRLDRGYGEESITHYRWSTSQSTSGSVVEKSVFIRGTFRNGSTYSWNPNTKVEKILIVAEDKNGKQYLKTDSSDKDTWLDKFPTC